MELVKNIFFNTDKLTSNSQVKISYTGKFFQDDSNNVAINYTFENDWKNKKEENMTRSDLGFQINIDIPDTDKFSFYFKNENDDSDNNEGNNYVFEITRPETALVVIKEKPLRHLRKSYIYSKKIKIAIYKLLRFIPKLITGNYHKKGSAQKI